jgi:hypothetical protein
MSIGDARLPDQDNAKDCGWEYGCPIVDDRRLFAEAVEMFLESDRPWKETYSLLGVMRKTWCKGHPPRGITPDLVACRQVCGRAVEGYIKTGSMGKFVTVLKMELEEREKERNRSIHHMMERAAF